MRNVIAALCSHHRHNRLLSSSKTFHSGRTSETLLWKFSSLGEKNYANVNCKHGLAFSQFYLWGRYLYSTGFTSVHGEGLSADYAKSRRKVLESEFGNVLGAHRSRTEKISVFYRSGPFLALYRATVISFHVLKLTVWHFFFRDMKTRSIKFRETLISLGPFYVKLGQALSTRTDILPNVYCQELAKLQDQIPPFPTHVAVKSIESQLGCPVSQIFADISSEPVAAASLGQVYKAHLHSGELVAVKVQRPGMALTLTLDALLFNMIGGQLKRFAAAREDLLVAVNEMVRHMFDEIDYILEGQNAERFASLYGSYPLAAGDQQYPFDTAGATFKHKKRNIVKVPKIFWKYTRKAVLTMEWIDGIKLTDEANLRNAFLNRKELIDQGVYCSLRQLLEVGFFHADPHPGNLVATKNGSLAYFDFGMMGNIPRHYRVGLIQVIVHFVNRDSLGLAKDYLSLGFLPEGVNVQSVADALRASFSDEKRQSWDFQAIMNQLYDVMYEFNFSLPPDYALVIRALGSLEGTAKALDPDFKVVESAYPFVIGRLLADPDPDMRKILRELVIRNDGSIRWNRLERLIAAIYEQASESVGESSNATTDSSNPLGWRSFDMHAVVSASEDLFEFILSEKGQRVRVFLVRDILEAIDAVLLDESLAFHETSESEEQVMIERVANGFRSFIHAVKLAPNLWMEMFIRMAMKPEVHRFSMDILSAICTHVNNKASETFWISLSKLLHGF